jgi:hypothetical protein
MIGFPRGAVRWTDVMILVATIALACAILRWADRQFRRVEGPSRFLRIEGPSQLRNRGNVHRPEWVWAMAHPYRRLQHDWLWISVVVTLGAAGMLALDRRTWHRWGLSRPGTIVVLVALLVGGATVAQQILMVPLSSRPNGLCYSLRNALEFRMPGAILGVWVVTWLRPVRGRPDWRERFARSVGWIWIANVGLLIGFGLIVG